MRVDSGVKRSIVGYEDGLMRPGKKLKDDASLLGGVEILTYNKMDRFGDDREVLKTTAIALTATIFDSISSSSSIYDIFTVVLSRGERELPFGISFNSNYVTHVTLASSNFQAQHVRYQQRIEQVYSRSDKRQPYNRKYCSPMIANFLSLSSRYLCLLGSVTSWKYRYHFLFAARVGARTVRPKGSKGICL